MDRPIVFLSDFGLDDEFVGICHGVIARIAPDSRVIDLTHGIPPQDMLRAALVLANSVRYAPDDAVYLGVVDPGVGTERRPIAAETASGHLTVGPDNNLWFTENTGDRIGRLNPLAGSDAAIQASIAESAVPGAGRWVRSVRGGSGATEALRT